MDYKVVEFVKHGDARGQLIAIEQGAELPFAVKRIYYIFDTLTDVRRGFHAHKTLQQMLFCVSGSCVIHLDDGRGHTEEILLDKPEKGLLLEGLIWREMYDFTPGAVLVVAASERYDVGEYIRDYDEFVRCVQQANAGAEPAE